MPLQQRPIPIHWFRVKDKTEVKRKGVATSVLKKINGDWKIMISHSSSVEAVKTTSVYSCGKW